MSEHRKPSRLAVAVATAGAATTAIAVIATAAGEARRIARRHAAGEPLFGPVGGGHTSGVPLPPLGYRALKRGFDTVAASAAIVALSPVLAATAAAVKLTSPGPAVFKQERYGKDREVFTCYKFRSMTVDTPPDVPTAVMNEDESVMTPIGAALRRSSLDELPQLANIAMGDMSVVGPRPVILAEADQVEAREAYGANDIRPGLTGWAQVNGRDLLTVEQKARLDGEYRAQMGPAKDAEIILRTVGVVAGRVGYAAGGGKRAERAAGRAAGAQGGMPSEAPSSATGPLKILVVCQHYWPEDFQVTALSEELAARGHEVTALVGLPNYPGGVVPEEYRRGRNRRETRNGVHIVRAYERGRGKGVVNLALNYYSYSTAACVEAAKLPADFDVVIAYQLSPVMMARPAMFYKRLHGTPVLLYCCDLWPESMKVVLGERLPQLLEVYRLVSSSIYRAADLIAVQSPAFPEYFKRVHGIDSAQMRYVPQFASDEYLDEDFTPEPHEGASLVLMGNVGRAQIMPCVLEAVALMERREELTLHVVGDGACLEESKALAAELGIEGTVLFHGRRPYEEMPEWYRRADGCLLALDGSSSIGTTIPSRLQGYMAAGKPVIASIDGGGREVVEEARCGVAVPAGDPGALAKALDDFAADPQAYAPMGAAGREYFKRNFTRRRYVDSIERLLGELVRGSIAAAAAPAVDVRKGAVA